MPMRERNKSEEDEMSSNEVCLNGMCMRSSTVDAKLDVGDIHEAESSLREGLSLNYEVNLLGLEKLSATL